MNKQSVTEKRDQVVRAYATARTAAMLRRFCNVNGVTQSDVINDHIVSLISPDGMSPGAPSTGPMRRACQAHCSSRLRGSSASYGVVPSMRIRV